SALRLGLLQHRVEGFGLHPERDMQIQRVLVLELKGQVRHLEEGEARAVVHLEEGVQRAALGSSRSRIDRKRVDQAKAEEVLVKAAGLLGIPAAIRVAMQVLDDVTLR